MEEEALKPSFSCYKTILQREAARIKVISVKEERTLFLNKAGSSKFCFAT